MAAHDDPYSRLGKALADVLGMALTEAGPSHQSAAADDGGIRLYSPDQIADRLDISLTSVKALLGRDLEIVHIGRSVKVPSDALDAYIARLRGKERQRVQGEGTEPINLGRSRQHRAASSAAGRTRGAGRKKRPSEAI